MCVEKHQPPSQCDETQPCTNVKKHERPTSPGQDESSNTRFVKTEIAPTDLTCLLALSGFAVIAASTAFIVLLSAASRRPR